MQQYWARRGEWLEMTPGRSLIRQEQQLEDWLRHTLGVPQHLLSAWKHSEGLKVAGDRLRMRVFADEPCDYEAADEPAEILYEDDACLVAYKPAGMAVHPTTPEQHAARHTLAHAVACHYAWTGVEARIRHIHRLDTDTSGPVLYAKTALSHAILDEAMRHKAIDRQYAAVVQGKVASLQGTIDAPIGKDRHHRGRRRVTDNGDHAVTHYEVVRCTDSLSLVRCTLETGRTHQIRVHMSHIGHPLAGDVLYGGGAQHIRRQALHGELLRFHHPFGGDYIQVQAPMPSDMAHLCQKI
ncbi:RluA family pseudouridine synthase [Paenibacillus arenosi]|uniref:Pseudouridine synthase n=1 Tax=Paenibacillus arenosi TaxID=2774142 RepID=A0ABR9B5Q1_9BACL|nr:RluA family pseudouridine synthase [Paenibacillus arenosi]MBD8500795.1 RluA family pseudouridine synthase [Paenibacillus arenosi]